MNPGTNDILKNMYKIYFESVDLKLICQPTIYVLHEKHPTTATTIPFMKYD